jgi:hypothetical protein
MAGLRAGTDRHRGVVLLPELERRTHPPALGLGPLAPVIARLMPGQEERNADHPPGGRGGDPLQQPPGARLEDRPAARQSGAPDGDAGECHEPRPAACGQRYRGDAHRMTPGLTMGRPPRKSRMRAAITGGSPSRRQLVPSTTTCSSSRAGSANTGGDPASSSCISARAVPRASGPERQLDLGNLAPRSIGEETHRGAGDAVELRDQRPGQGQPAAAPLLGVRSGEPAQRDHETHDLFLADLARPADAVVWGSRQQARWVARDRWLAPPTFLLHACSRSKSWCATAAGARGGSSAR